MKIIEKLKEKWWDRWLSPECSDVEYRSPIEDMGEAQEKADIMKAMIDENICSATRKCLTIEDFYSPNEK